MEDPTQATLERMKLLAEVAHLEAQARNESLKADALALDWEWRTSRPENRGDALELLFAGEVDAATVQEAILTLNVWDRKWPGAPVTIVLNSPGGSVIEGLALYDYLRAMSGRGHELTIRSIGWAASMGAVILQAGDVREMGENSFMLIHEVSNSMRGKASAMEDDYKFTQRLQDKLLGILSARSTLSVDEVREGWTRRDWWLDAQEAVSLGFADRVA